MAQPFKADKIQTNELATTSSAGIGVIKVSASLSMETTKSIEFWNGETAMSASKVGHLHFVGINFHLSGTAIATAMSAAQITGSLTLMADGRSFLAAGTNATVTTGSDGQVTISSATPTLDDVLSDNIANSIDATVQLSGSTSLTGGTAAEAQDVFCITGAFVVASPNDDDKLRVFLDGSTAKITASQGDVEISPGAGSVVIFTQPSGQATLVVKANASDVATLDLREGANSRVQLKADNAKEQALLSVHSDVMRKLIITDAANANRDHDHVVAVNPTLVIHSVTNPDTDNAEYIAIHSDGAGTAVFTSGKGSGDIALSGSGNVSYVTERTGVLSFHAVNALYDGSTYNAAFYPTTPSSASNAYAPAIKSNFDQAKTFLWGVSPPVNSKIVHVSVAGSWLVSDEKTLALVRYHLTGTSAGLQTKLASAGTTTASGSSDVTLENLSHLVEEGAGYIVSLYVENDEDYCYGGVVKYVYNDLER